MIVAMIWAPPEGGSTADQVELLPVGDVAS